HFVGRIAGHLCEGRVDVNDLRAGRIELRRRDDNRFSTLFDRRFEQSQFLFGWLLTGDCRVWDERARRAYPNSGALSLLFAPVSFDSFALEGGKSDSERAIHLDRLADRRAPLRFDLPPSGLLDGRAYGAAQFFSCYATLFETIMRAALHRINRRLRVARADQRNYGAI